MTMKWLALILFGSPLFGASPYWSNYGSTTAGKQFVTMTGDFEVRQATATNVKVFKVNNQGAVEAFGGLSVSSSPSAPASLFVDPANGRVGINSLTPINALDVIGHLSVVGNILNASWAGNIINGSFLGGGSTSYIQNTSVLQSGAVFNVSSGSALGTLTSYGGFVGGGSLLQNLNASNITAGTLADGRLSSNVPLKNSTNTFTAQQYFMQNVGIGTAVPGTFTGNASSDLVIGSGVGARGLTVFSGNASQGALSFADGVTGNEQYRGSLVYSHATDKMHFLTSGNNNVTIDGSGNVGISTTVPLSFLQVDTAGGDIGSNTDKNGIRLSTILNGGRSWLLSQGVAGQDNRYFGLRDVTAGAYRMVVDLSGNVGINTTTPAQKLSVVGNGYFSGNIGIGTTSPTGKLVVGDDIGGFTGNYSIVSGRTDGNSGIAVGQSVTAYGLMRWNYNATEANATLEITTPGNKIALTGGNVGIGTAAPAQKLDVLGGVKISGAGSPTTGGAVCLNASNVLSKCTSAVDASGNCTCP